MKKQILKTSVIILSIFIYAINALCQDTYIASNGITYQVGDSVKMGMGSKGNGGYQSLTLAGFLAIASYDQNKGAEQLDASHGFYGLLLPILKIKHTNYFGQKIVYFVVKANGKAKFNLMIESAIELCEISPCKGKINNASNSEADEIGKFKKLFDEGAITQEEYDTKKKSILMKR